MSQSGTFDEWVTAGRGGPKTSIGFRDSLEGLPELRGAVTLMIIVYYSERIQAVVSKGERCTGQRPGETWCKSFPLSSPWRHRDSTRVGQQARVVPAGSSLSLGVQDADRPSGWPESPVPSKVKLILGAQCPDHESYCVTRAESWGARGRPLPTEAAGSLQGGLRGWAGDP